MDDAFIPVRSKRKGRRKPKVPLDATANGLAAAATAAAAADVDENYVHTKLEAAKNDLACSDYWTVLKNALGLESTFSNIVCLGLGQFGSSVTSRWQAALLLLLKEHFRPEKTVVYDPLFDEAERKLLAEAGCEIPRENDEGFLTFAGSLFYMPHCGKPLLNSVVYANRRHLTSVTIFGNSIQTMFDNVEFLNRLRAGKLTALKEVEQSLDEMRVSNVFRFKDVFNDLSVVRFHSDLLKDVPRPVYSIDDEIILREAMQNLSVNET